jgi:nicotinate dehydrogenase subunit B
MRPDDVLWSSQSSALVADIKISLNDAGKIISYVADHRGPPIQDDRLVGALLAGKPVIDAPSPETSYGFQSGLLNMNDAWVYGMIASVQEQWHGTYQLGEEQSPNLPAKILSSSGLIMSMMTVSRPY